MKKKPKAQAPADYVWTVEHEQYGTMLQPKYTLVSDCDVTGKRFPCITYRLPLKIMKFVVDYFHRPLLFYRWVASDLIKTDHSTTMEFQFLLHEVITQWLRNWDQIWFVVIDKLTLTLKINITLIIFLAVTYLQNNNKADYLISMIKSDQNFPLQ